MGGVGHQLATLAPAVIVSGKDVHGAGRVRETSNPYEMSETGNSVSLEEQAVRISRNAMDYQLALTLYTKSVAMLRAAIGQRR